MRARITAAFLLLSGILPAFAEEPLEGTWKMTSQKVGEKTVAPEAIVLKVTKAAVGLNFEYSQIVNATPSMVMKFSAHLDGSETEILDANGHRMGLANVTKAGANQYRLILRSPTRPPSSGTMTVSDRGKTLTSESDTERPGGESIHAVQVFARAN